MTHQSRSQSRPHSANYTPSLYSPPKTPLAPWVPQPQQQDPIDPSLNGLSMPKVPFKSPLVKTPKKRTPAMLHAYDSLENKPLPSIPAFGRSPLLSYTSDSPRDQSLAEDSQLAPLPPGRPKQNGPSLGNPPPLPPRPLPRQRPPPRKPSIESLRSVSSLIADLVRDPNPPFGSRSSMLTTSTTATSRYSGTTAVSGPATTAITGGPDWESHPSDLSMLTGRRYALLELLTSERVYAADLALVKNIHIPLSRGLPLPFHQSEVNGTINATFLNPGVSASGVVGSLTAVAGDTLISLPMTREASKTIFGNVEELAVFSDTFSERLEMALGDILDGGQGQDCVGELFLEVIPVMGPSYKTYITRYPTALAQFQSLPPSIALTTYINFTRQLTASHTSAWDIPSLLIKPVQQLLKYRLLLQSIHNKTPDDHPDKSRLEEARDRIDEVSRNVIEGHWRWEVVKTVLSSQVDPGSQRVHGGALASPLPSKIRRILSFKQKVKPSILDGPDRDKNAREEMDLWEKRIKESEVVLKELAKDSLQWSRETRNTFVKLKGWNSQFGDAVGLGESGVEAVGAFGKVVGGLQTLWLDLDQTLQSILLPQLQKLLRTLSSPLVLITHMQTLYHSHLLLLNTPYNKSRPPNALIEASNDYLALQATLREELPAFFTLFEKGLTWILIELSRWQSRFWREVRQHWLTFWAALGVEGDSEAQGNSRLRDIGSGAAETMAIWWERYEEVEQIVQNLWVTNSTGDDWDMVKEHEQEPGQDWDRRKRQMESVVQLPKEQEGEREREWETEREKERQRWQREIEIDLERVYRREPQLGKMKRERARVDQGDAGRSRPLPLPQTNDGGYQEQPTKLNPFPSTIPKTFDIPQSPLPRGRPSNRTLDSSSTPQPPQHPQALQANAFDGCVDIHDEDMMSFRRLADSLFPQMRNPGRLTPLPTPSILATAVTQPHVPVESRRLALNSIQTRSNDTSEDNALKPTA